MTRQGKPGASIAADTEGGRAVRRPGTISAAPSFPARIARLDWAAIEGALDEHGYATTTPLLHADECTELTRLFSDDRRFRSRIDMARYRFGVGEYRYFAAPLPEPVAALRGALYARLAPVANRWMTALGQPERYPPDLDAYLARCAAHGQDRPTPLLLHYTAGGYNCLHQDLYGELAFPLQVVFVLSRAGVDYTGGELLLVEQRPRAQSRGHAVAIEQGAGVVFATRERPVAGARGSYRVVMRHGVSTIRSGARMSLGIIFHDAK